MTRILSKLALGAVLATPLYAGCAADPASVRIDGAGALEGTSGGLPEYAFLEEQSLTPEDLEQIWMELPYERIGVSRSGCASACPDYEVTFIRGSGDEARGRVSYQGRGNVEKLGELSGSVNLRDYARLCQLADRLGFMQLEAEYRAPWEGDATTSIRVNHREGLREVVDYGNQGPPELIALQLAIDGTVRWVTWDESAE